MSKYVKNKNGEYICPNTNCNFIVKDKKNSNYNYVNLKKHIAKNIFYPNIYIFGVFYFIKKIYQKLFMEIIVKHFLALLDLKI